MTQHNHVQPGTNAKLGIRIFRMQKTKNTKIEIEKKLSNVYVDIVVGYDDEVKAMPYIVTRTENS